LCPDLHYALSLWRARGERVADRAQNVQDQRTRDHIIAKFKAAKTMLLCATDVAQRGLDVKGVSHVINYDLPDRIDDCAFRAAQCC
jgi:superfamily II DNA/RNA helicase